MQSISRLVYWAPRPFHALRLSFVSTRGAPVNVVAWACVLLVTSHTRGRGMSADLAVICSSQRDRNHTGCRYLSKHPTSPRAIGHLLISITKFERSCARSRFAPASNLTCSGCRPIDRRVDHWFFVPRQATDLRPPLLHLCVRT